MIWNDTAESAEDGNGQRFTAAETLRTLNRAGSVAGIDVSGARLMRIGEHAIYRLPDRIIARIARTAAYEPDARKEVAVARWLEGQGYPAVRALTIDQPIIVDGRVVTFWDLISDKE